MPNRSKRVVVIAHCILNQNAKVGGLANEPGFFLPIVERLHAQGLGMIQLPCPELICTGVRRWWQTKRQYDIPSFRRYCCQQAVAVADQLVDYARNGYEIAAILGVDGSPTCGVNFCGTDTNAGGPPHITIPSPRREEKGILMEELLTEIETRELPPIPMLGLDLESDAPIQDVVAQLDQFLETGKS